MTRYDQLKSTAFDLICVELEKKPWVLSSATLQDEYLVGASRSFLFYFYFIFLGLGLGLER